MKVYVGRRLDGEYEIAIHDESIEWNKKFGFDNINLYDYLAKCFHEASTLRLRKGQMKIFDKMEFK